MSYRKRYSREEDEAIFRAVEDRENITMKACFIALAEQLERTPTGVAARWYEISNPESPHYVGTAMLLLTKHRAAQNRTTFKFPVQTRLSIWSRIKRYLGL